MFSLDFYSTFCCTFSQLSLSSFLSTTHPTFSLHILTQLFLSTFSFYFLYVLYRVSLYFLFVHLYMCTFFSTFSPHTLYTLSSLLTLSGYFLTPFLYISILLSFSISLSIFSLHFSDLPILISFYTFYLYVFASGCQFISYHIATCINIDKFVRLYKHQRYVII